MLHHVNGRIHEGKIAIITGSSRGIGAAIARNLAQKGANLVLTYQQESSDAAADLLVEEFCTTYSVKAVKCRADIATCEGVDSIVSACATLCAPSKPLQIDIIVNNAACFSSLPLDKIDAKDFAHTYETNVLGPILLTQRCLPYLPPDRSGRIVNISSVATKVNPAGSTLHAGTKAALESMTRTWARELADSCTVNAVSTGFTMTDMLRDASDEVRNGMKIYNPFTPLSKIQSHDSAKQREVAEKQGGRAGYPEEVAGIVGIICSPESSWMTGCLLGANGGLTMIA